MGRTSAQGARGIAADRTPNTLPLPHPWDVVCGAVGVQHIQALPVAGQHTGTQAHRHTDSSGQLWAELVCWQFRPLKGTVPVCEPVLQVAPAPVASLLLFLTLHCRSTHTRALTQPLTQPLAQSHPPTLPPPTHTAAHTITHPHNNTHPPVLARLFVTAHHQQRDGAHYVGGHTDVDEAVQRHKQRLSSAVGVQVAITLWLFVWGCRGAGVGWVGGRCGCDGRCWW